MSQGVELFPTHTLFAKVVVGLSMGVVGICLYMAWVQAKKLFVMRHRWDVWWLLVYLGLANTVGLIAEAIWGTPALPITWRGVSYTVGLACIGIGVLGSAWSVGSRDKRATDR